MSPVNESNVANINGLGEAAVAEAAMKKFKFPSHQFHIVNLAKMCQENKDFTDCVIRVGEEELRAHRLVLGSVSPFLKLSIICASKLIKLEKIVTACICLQA